MDVLERYDKLKTKAIQIRAQAQQSYKTCFDIKGQYDQITKKYQEDRDSLNIQNFAIDTLKEIMDKMSQEHVEKVVNLLTYALQSIFYDRNYMVEIVTSDKRGVKTADLMLVEQTEAKVVRSPFSDAIGGGILAVCGLVLQIYYSHVLNQSPVLFLDEQLSQVSSEYIPTLMAFVKELASSKELILVLISHDDRYMAYADRKYEVDSGNVREVK